MTREPTESAGPPTNRTVELFVRSPLQRADHEASDAVDGASAVVDRLDALLEDGHLTDYSVSVWGREVGLATPAAETGDGRAVLERVAALRSWAAEHGVVLEGFRRRETTAVTGETHTVLTLPAVVLAEYVDGELSSVVPHSEGGRARTVDERLETLSSARPLDRRAGAAPAQPP